MAHSQASSDEEDYIKLFKLIDKDGDGSLTFREIRLLFKSMGRYINDAEIRKIIKSADKDNNGKLELDEFIMYMEKRNAIDKDRTSEDERILKMFSFFDTDRDGLISRKQLKNLLTMSGEEITDEEIDAIMEEVDEDKNGVIDFDEFKYMLKILN